jgi:hypothetical protein
LLFDYYYDGTEVLTFLPIPPENLELIS